MPGSASCVWRFNALYWQALAAWEKTTGKDYEQTLPGGESDARNSAAAREVILDLFSSWDELASRRALPEQLYVIELGVGNGGQARTWLDEFVELDRRHGRDYYRRLHYLMGDYSAHVLDRARQEVAHHGDHVSGLVLEATRLSGSVGFLAGKAFLVYISNVYDNLPSDEVAVIRGRMYLVQTRCLPGRPPPRTRSPPGSGSSGPRSRSSPSGCCGSAPSCSPSRSRTSSPTPARRSCSGRRSGRRCARPSATCRLRAWTPTGSRPR